MAKSEKAEANYVFRCRSCHEFFRERKVAEVKCEGCDFRTVRCKKCGGIRGAIRSIRAHAFWFYHNGKYHDRPEVVKPHLRVLDGGRLPELPRLRVANSRR